MQLQKVSPSEYVARIVELENISKVIAQEFVDHKMGLRCIKSEPPCPKCGKSLKTWHARLCLNCDWTRDATKQLPDYYIKNS